MSYTLAELADYVSGHLVGDGNLSIDQLATLERAQPGSLTFYHNEQYQKQLQNTQASAVILQDKHQHLVNRPAVIVVDDPYYAYAKIAHLFAYQPSKPEKAIHPTAVVGSHCDIASSAIIGANVVISDHVTIGENTRIDSNCTIAEGVDIGRDCYLHSGVQIDHHVYIGNQVNIASGTVIGSDGFGFAWYDNRWHKVPQLGSVIIHDDVDIGANTTIDRGALEDTVIGSGVRLDNQIQIAHNVEIGDYTILAGCVGVAGSAKIGRFCMLGGGAGVVGHIHIADHVIITGMTMVSHTISEPGIYSSGTGIQDNRTWRKNVVRFRQLDKLYRQVKSLEKTNKD